MEKRNKVLMVSKTMSQKRAEDLERITSEYGTMLRMNRSIQAEGSFADVKEDMNFRRYLYRGKVNALAESILLAMGRNISLSSQPSSAAPMAHPTPVMPQGISAFPPSRPAQR